jgi:hypothetical protein
MFKFDSWDYFRFTILFLILSSLCLMRSYPEYGSKGEYNLSEHGAESVRYLEKGSIEKKVICNKNCERDCRANDKLNKISEILNCLDSCACNSPVVLGTEVSRREWMAYLILFSFVSVLVLVFILNKKIIKKIFALTMYKLNKFSKTTSGSIYQEEDEEVLNDYKKLNDF